MMGLDEPQKSLRKPLLGPQGADPQFFALNGLDMKHPDDKTCVVFLVLPFSRLVSEMWTLCRTTLALPDFGQ
jgi:hypothetical protein